MSASKDTAKQAVYVVNAFTSSRFGGNPAAVMIMDQWLPDTVLLAIAEQHNLSETAFLVPISDDRFGLRWFTPAAEVELCGHATLASAYVLRQCLGYMGNEVFFETRFSGVLGARFLSSGIQLDFPAIPVLPHQPEAELVSALGCDVVAAAIPRDHPWKALYEVESEQVLLAMKPDFQGIADAVEHAVIVTARGEQHDFVSRFFAPRFRINEDPVTGSAHCVLSTYWADKLGTTQFLAAQRSARGGELQCELAGDRVNLVGNCVLYSQGEIMVDLASP